MAGRRQVAGGVAISMICGADTYGYSGCTDPGCDDSEHDQAGDGTPRAQLFTDAD